ncbi:hypothetical protein QFZ33_002492 [Arthrobacter globiformis]|nr:hypothetical protein [Arthrobacter globiformis]
MRLTDSWTSRTACSKYDPPFANYLTVVSWATADVGTVSKRRPGRGEAGYDGTELGQNGFHVRSFEGFGSGEAVDVPAGPKTGNRTEDQVRMMMHVRGVAGH